jgi:hypothetical protein
MWRRLGQLGPDGRAIWTFQAVTLVVAAAQVACSADGVDSIGMGDPIAGLAILVALFCSLAGLNAGWEGRAAAFFRWTLAAQVAATVQFTRIAESAAGYWAWAMSTGDPVAEASANGLLAWNAVVLATTAIVGLVCVHGIQRTANNGALAAG